MSAITAYTSLIGDVLLGMDPAPPEKLVERALRHAGRLFCKESGAWQEEVAVIDLVAYQSDYTITHDYSTNALIEHVVWAKRDGNPMGLNEFEVIPTATFRFVPNAVPGTSTGISAYSAAATYAVGDKAQYSGVNYRCRAAIDTPESFTATNWTRIDDGLYLKVAFRPTYEATYLPAWFFDRWAETLVHGAHAHLYGQTRAAWGDPRAAKEAANKFRAGINEGKRETIMEYRGGDISIYAGEGRY